MKINEYENYKRKENLITSFQDERMRNHERETLNFPHCFTRTLAI